MNRKYQRGQRVVVDGYDEIFIVQAFFYEYSDDAADGEWESAHYELKSEKSGLFLDFIDQDDKSMRALDEPKTLDSYEIDALLDKYNDCMNIDSLLKSTGVNDSEYETKAKEIMEYLQKT